MTYHSVADASQKSISYLLRLCCHLVAKIHNSAVITLTPREKHGIATLFMSQILSEVAQRNPDGFGEFGFVGSMHVHAQDWFLDFIWDNLEPRFNEFQSAVLKYNPGVSVGEVRPFVSKYEKPNCFSFIHLAYQSIKHDHVLPFSPCLITENGHSEYGRKGLSIAGGVFVYVCV